jgi:ADP-glucose pyrophosphorylase
MPQHTTPTQTKPEKQGHINNGCVIQKPVAHSPVARQGHIDNDYVIQKKPVVRNPVDRRCHLENGCIVQ